MNINGNNINFILWANIATTILLFSVLCLFLFLLLKCFEQVEKLERWSTGSNSLVDSRSTSDTLDLFGYQVDFALTRLKKYMDSKERAGKYFAIVTTGRGLQRPNRRPLVRNAVKTWLDRNEYSYEVHDGDFKVYLKNEMFVNLRKQAQNEHFNFY